MANIRSFKELRVWQNAMDAAMRVFEVTKRFPGEERYSMTDQFRRASRSVAANIAEAWRKRRYVGAFVSKLSDAEGEAAECQTWTELALRCGYLPAQEAVELDGCFDQILGQLVCMIDRPEEWVVGANRKTDAEKGRHGDAVNPPAGPPRVAESPRPRVSGSPRPAVIARAGRGSSHG